MNTSTKHPHTKQLHEKFKLIDVTLENGKLSKQSKKDVEKFLSESKVHAISVGAFTNPSTHQVTISIGYDERRSKKHSYKLGLKQINKSGVVIDTDKIEKKMNSIARASGKVICHEILTSGEDIYAVILSADQKS